MSNRKKKSRTLKLNWKVRNLFPWLFFWFSTAVLFGSLAFVTEVSWLRGFFMTVSISSLIAFIGGALLLTPFFGLYLDRMGIFFRGPFHSFYLKWKDIGAIEIYHLGFWGPVVQITFPRKINRSSKSYPTLLNGLRYFSLPPYFRKNLFPNVKLLPALGELDVFQLHFLLNTWKENRLTVSAIDADKFYFKAKKQNWPNLDTPSLNRYQPIAHESYLFLYLLMWSVFILAGFFLPSWLSDGTWVSALGQFVFYGPLSAIFFFRMLRRKKYYVHEIKWNVIEEEKFLFFTLSRRLIIEDCQKIGLEDYCDGRLRIYPVTLIGATGRCNLGTHLTKTAAFLHLSEIRHQLPEDSLKMEIPLGFMDGHTHEETPLWKVIEVSTTACRITLPLIALGIVGLRVYQYLHQYFL